MSPGNKTRAIRLGGDSMAGSKTVCLVKIQDFSMRFEFQELPFIHLEHWVTQPASYWGKQNLSRQAQVHAGCSVSEHGELPAWRRDCDLSLEGGAGRAVERASAWDKGQGQRWSGSQHTGLAGRTGPGGRGRPSGPKGGSESSCEGLDHMDSRP